MRIFLVGGALRDRLLGLPVRERDFVVVGATAEQMLEQGFQQVGRDFPVFLHPQTHEEYALARSRRRPGKGDGRPHADPSVSLEEDLARRDLTINALAESEDGLLIDPFGGRQDLRARLLRHVSPAFTEDPVRVLRLARFMARYQGLGFRVAEETLVLMRRMAESGALDALVAERVWQELTGALACEDPRPFFDTLRCCGALVRVFPEIDRLWGVPQPKHWHPEIDCGIHSMLVLRMACRLSPLLEVRFAALTHDLGKGTTPDEMLPSHHGHEARGARLVGRLCERLRAPKRFRLLAERCANYHGLCHRLDELNPRTIIRLLERLDAFRQPEAFASYLLVCEADYRGRQGRENRPYPQAREFQRLFDAARQVDTCTLQYLSDGRAIGKALHDLRLAAIKAAKSQ
ncbi:MAG: multifunctional CCA addition/repair protein [Pseudomonadota bacterium]